MLAKQLKEWVNSLPDDALVHVIQSPIHSIPLSNPVLYAIDAKTIEQPVKGFIAGKVISSIQERPGIV